MQRYAFRFVLRVWLGFLLVCGTSAAIAHTTSLRVPLVPVVGSPSPIVLGSRTEILFLATKGGRIKFKLRDATDVSGNRIDATDNTLHIDLLINGVPQPLLVPFDITKGKAQVSVPTLGLVKPDLVEVSSIELRDQSGTPFGRMGVQIP